MRVNRLMSVLLLLPYATPSQELAASRELPRMAHVVRASADAVVTAKPDRAELTIGIDTQAATAQDASAQNARQTTQVLEVIKHALGAAGEIKTSGYSIAPDYQYPKSGGSPKIVGYHASNNLHVTIDDLAPVGKLIDVAAKTGANNIGGVSFTLRNEQPVRAQALAEAAAMARANAEAIAKALNLRVLGVLEAESAEAVNVRPIVTMQRSAQPLAAAPIATPIETGDISIHASVVVTLEVQ